MGLKEHVTTIPAHLMAAGDVVSSCHEPWHVEASLPMSEHGLRSRPVFHHATEATCAHSTAVRAALAAARYL